MLRGENTCTTIALVVILMLILMDARRSRASLAQTCGTDCEEKKKKEADVVADEEEEEEEAVAARAAATKPAEDAAEVRTSEPTIVNRTEREEKYKKAFVTALQPTSDCTKATRSKGIPGLQHTMLAAMKCGGDASEQKGYACAEDKLPSSTCMWHMAPAHMPLQVALKMQEEDAKQQQQEPSLIAKRDGVAVA